MIAGTVVWSWAMRSWTWTVADCVTCRWVRPAPCCGCRCPSWSWSWTARMRRLPALQSGSNATRWTTCWTRTRPPSSWWTREINRRMMMSSMAAIVTRTLTCASTRRNILTIQALRSARAARAVHPIRIRCLMWRHLATCWWSADLTTDTNDARRRNVFRWPSTTLRHRHRPPHRTGRVMRRVLHLRLRVRPADTKWRPNSALCRVGRCSDRRSRSTRSSTRRERARRVWASLWSAEKIRQRDRWASTSRPSWQVDKPLKKVHSAKVPNYAPDCHLFVFKEPKSDKVQHLGLLTKKNDFSRECVPLFCLNEIRSKICGISSKFKFNMKNWVNN